MIASNTLFDFSLLLCHRALDPRLNSSCRLFLGSWRVLIKIRQSPSRSQTARAKFFYLIHVVPRKELLKSLSFEAVITPSSALNFNASKSSLDSLLSNNSQFPFQFCSATPNFTLSITNLQSRAALFSSLFSTFFVNALPFPRLITLPQPISPLDVQKAQELNRKKQNPQKNKHTLTTLHSLPFNSHKRTHTEEHYNISAILPSKLHRKLDAQAHSH